MHIVSGLGRRPSKTDKRSGGSNYHPIDAYMGGLRGYARGSPLTDSLLQSRGRFIANSVPWDLLKRSTIQSINQSRNENIR